MERMRWIVCVAALAAVGTARAGELQDTHIPVATDVNGTEQERAQARCIEDCKKPFAAERRKCGGKKGKLRSECSKKYAAKDQACTEICAGGQSQDDDKARQASQAQTAAPAVDCDAACAQTTQQFDQVCPMSGKSPAECKQQHDTSVQACLAQCRSRK